MERWRGASILIGWTCRHTCPISLFFFILAASSVPVASMKLDSVYLGALTTTGLSSTIRIANSFNSSRILAYSGSTLYASTTRGSSWTTLSTTGFITPTSAYTFTMSSDGRYVISGVWTCASGSNSGSLYKSSNFGITWAATAAANKGYSAIAISPSGRYMSGVYGATNCNGVLGTIDYSIDFGVSWNAISISRNLQGTCAGDNGYYAVSASNGYTGVWMSTSIPIPSFTKTFSSSSDSTGMACSATLQYIFIICGGVMFGSSSYGSSGSFTSRYSGSNINYASPPVVSSSGKYVMFISSTNTYIIGSVNYGVSFAQISPTVTSPLFSGWPTIGAFSWSEDSVFWPVAASPYLYRYLPPSPTAKPSGQPTRQPTRQPTGQPTRQPTAQPSRQPTRQPTGQPTRQPTAQPSRDPTSSPTSPSAQPSGRPTGQPSSCPTGQPNAQPSQQPSSRPSGQPSRQPTGVPSAQPSRHPTGQPSQQPSSRPSGQPNGRPSSQPSAQPSQQPTDRPTMQPSSRPSGQPSDQPTSQPSMRPSGQPSSKPSGQPSQQPSQQPSGKPSLQPTAMPSGQPSAQPSMQPSSRPSGQPSAQPTMQPSSRPSAQPSGRPTGQPTLHPLCPSGQPTNQPTNPSGQPTRQPTGQPTRQPTGQPSRRPTRQPTGQPTRKPTSQPSRRPSRQPSNQPTRRPTTQPSGQPSKQPTRQPTSRPTRPSGQPSGQPSRQPSSGPSSRPSPKPTPRPSSRPTRRPTGTPTRSPTLAELTGIRVWLTFNVRGPRDFNFLTLDLFRKVVLQLAPRLRTPAAGFKISFASPDAQRRAQQRNQERGRDQNGRRLASASLVLELDLFSQYLGANPDAAVRNLNSAVQQGVASGAVAQITTAQAAPNVTAGLQFLSATDWSYIIVSVKTARPSSVPSGAPSSTPTEGRAQVRTVSVSVLVGACLGTSAAVVLLCALAYRLLPRTVQPEDLAPENRKTNKLPRSKRVAPEGTAGTNVSKAGKSDKGAKRKGAGDRSFRVAPDLAADSQAELRGPRRVGRTREAAEAQGARSERSRFRSLRTATRLSDVEAGPSRVARVDSEADSSEYSDGDDEDDKDDDEAKQENTAREERTSAPAPSAWAFASTSPRLAPSSVPAPAAPRGSFARDSLKDHPRPLPRTEPSGPRK